MDIKLAKYIDSDFDLFKTMVSDDETMKYIAGNGWTENQARLHFDSMLEINCKEEGLGFYKVVNQENEFIGNCSLERYKYDSEIIEIGYVLKKEFWRKGYGSAICQEILAKANHLYSELEVIAIVNPDNLASKKLLEKYGFELYFKGLEDGQFSEKFILKRLSVD
ncbi:GNAT family N-acetyltransferase [Dyadobacter sp. CY312]|uniref:GNAT family N-acetyltransferase n=1 Tax=Dyadobacter sp. CY312 TaxID=2907303 RepID=UPI001F28DA85|nr:GNAT family N-acetyltransferase [Dyadobacter sp. CY312]MCE7044480.1 GNAT family N-acetyltransferase [Dyadobacter sp. CY312]